MQILTEQWQHYDANVQSAAFSAQWLHIYYFCWPVLNDYLQHIQNLTSTYYVANLPDTEYPMYYTLRYTLHTRYNYCHTFYLNFNSYTVSTDMNYYFRSPCFHLHPSLSTFGFNPKGPRVDACDNSNDAAPAPTSTHERCFLRTSLPPCPVPPVHLIHTHRLPSPLPLCFLSIPSSHFPLRQRQGRVSSRPPGRTRVATTVAGRAATIVE